MSAKSPGKGHTAKHTHRKVKHHKTTGKHHPAHHHKAATAGAGHHVHVVAKGAKHPVARGFAVGDLLPVCAFEAIAASLRLAGQPVSDDEVAWLWEQAGSRELSIEEALAAAARFGLAGCRPVQAERKELGGRDVQRFREADQLFGGYAPARVLDLSHGLPNPSTETERAHAKGQVFLLNAHTGTLGPEISSERIIESLHALNSCTTHAILGINTPGPHAVLATADGWWSWGQLYSPWPARIEEAWAVSWS